MSFRGTLSALIALALTALPVSGCGLMKRGDATNPLGLDKSQQIVKKFADQLEPVSTLARSSGPVTYLRLSKLFPSLTLAYGDFDPTPILQGSAPVIGSPERAYTALAQMALRQKASDLCKNDLNQDAAKAGSVFSTAGILVDGETLPTKPEELAAFAIARNAWLDLYQVSDPEVQQLVQVYLDTKNLYGGTDADAKRSVCMAALLSTQFWMGNPGKRDALRRVALEIGRRLPTFSELKDFEAGKFTLGQFVEKLQTDPSQQAGYIAAVHDWHQDWLGLRPQFDPTVMYQGVHAMDPRPSGSASAVKTAHLVISQVMSDGLRLEAQSNFGFAGTFQATEDCNPVKPGTANDPNVQAFDPRTTMLIFEHYDTKYPGTDVVSPTGYFTTSNGEWEIAAAWVLDGHLNDYKALLLNYLSDTDASAVIANDCQLVDTATDPVYLAGYSTTLPHYYRCKGRVRSADLASWVATDVSDIFYVHNSAQSGMGAFFEYIGYSQASQYVGTSVRLSHLGDTAVKFFTPNLRRIKRYSPTGLQDGVSQINRYFSGTPGYACNSLNRFFYTCAYRPPNSTWQAYTDVSWDASSYTLGWGQWNFPYRAANPHTLNMFHCGKPNLAGIATAPVPLGNSATKDYEESGSFPKGYTEANYDSATSLDPTLLNATNFYGRELDPDGFYAYGGENISLFRLLRDLDQEPYRLLEYILKNNRPYSELLTANYTFGSDELDLYYRSQGYLLPGYPAGYAPSPSGSPAATYHKIDFSTFADIPAAALRTSYGDYPAFAYQSPTGTIITTGLIRPKPAAGVLTMPAIIMPVQPKMRTLASRYFLRFLCGLPNVYTPSEADEAVQEKYMTISGRPDIQLDARQHLDKTQVCYSCHVNLDPLASALSTSFLPFVQADELHASFGEMDPGTQTAQGLYSMRTYGVRNGGETGQGAIFGQVANGVQDVARKLVSNRLWGRCVVHTAFQNVYGRPIAFEDVKLANELTDSFMANPDFNKLVRDLVDSPNFLREN